ncbi:MAG: peptidoglycan DD-metalloendopeptidase family protein [Alphaproteobacteria bacterium]|nr:peptidoglycan DD-metalloendopeptidase family protein [Alphaproteobacteria bacterium]
MADRAAYDAWLATAPPPADIMAGLREAKPVRLDAETVDARGRRKSDGELAAKYTDALLFGGYGEDRAMYATPLFNPGTVEPRTLHIGLDIFGPAGAALFAPVAGRIHSFQDNDQPGDYGPAIILEHEPAEGVVFHTLYGHLSRSSLKGLAVGNTITVGQKLGELGERSENGGWLPHVHVQVLLEIGDAKGDYPGVCRRSEAARWLAACPDPRPLLGLATA